MKHPNLLMLSAVPALSIGAFFVLSPEGPARLEPLGGVEVELDEARIYWEYNATAEDLGVHVFIDGEDWRGLKIVNPDKTTIFKVRGTGPYTDLGLTELFYEGAEPELSEVPLQELLDRFPEGEYEFEGRTVEGDELEGETFFSHAIPDGPAIAAQTGPNDFLEIKWSAVTAPPLGFPDRPINVVAYQVIVEPSFQATVPAGTFSLTISPEYVATLGAGTHKFEVLAIEESGNQTLTEGEFTL